MASHTDLLFPIEYYNLPAGVTPKLHANEQSPATFESHSSVYLPPLGFDAKGTPYYHPFGGTADPYNRVNKSYDKYVEYKTGPTDLKQQQSNLQQALTTIPTGLIVAVMVAAVLAGLIFAGNAVKK